MLSLRQLHEELRNYGNLDDRDKPLVVAGIALAIHYKFQENKFDKYKANGEAIYECLKSHIKDKTFLQEMELFKTNNVLNQKNQMIKATPVRYFFQTFRKIALTNGYDYMGELYSELMRYTNGNAQNLGIVLTPKKLTKLCVKLAEVQEDDIILDPCAGTGGFLLESNTKAIGIEFRSYIYTLALANIILYNRIKDIEYYCNNMFQVTATGTVGITNPPYSQGTEKTPDMYEANFINRLTQLITPGKKVVAIVPRSTFAIGAQEKTKKRNELLKNNTLDGIISIGTTLFAECTVSPCICIFTAGVPHDSTKESIFVDASDEQDIDKIYDLWKGNIKSNKVIYHNINENDEWLYDYFVEKTQPPTKKDLEPTIKDYMQFRHQAILNNREYLLFPLPKYNHTENIHWERWTIDSLFELGKVHKRKNLRKGKFPVISAMTTNNGQLKYVEMKTEEGGVIVVESAVAGYSTYQHYPFTVNDHVTKLIPKFKMNPYIALYISSLLNFEHKNKYSYGYKPTKKRLPKEEIYVPVNEKGELAVTYMTKEVSDMIWAILDKLAPNEEGKYAF